MPIAVIMKGHSDELPEKPVQQVFTFAGLVAIISDEIDDTTGEYLPQVRNAIFSAIRFCEREPYYFNETREETFQTVNEKSWYGKEDNPVIGTLVGLTNVYCDYGSGIRRELIRDEASSLEIFDDRSAARGIPFSYTYYNRKIRLYPVPSGGPYTIRMMIAPVRFDPITLTDQGNPWFTEAFELIKARAKYELYKNILKDPDMTIASFTDFEEQRNALAAETSRRNGSSIFCPTGF